MEPLFLLFDLELDLPVVAALVECNYFNNISEISLQNLPTSAPMPFLGNDTLICAGSSLVLNPGVFSSYLWGDGSQLDTLVTSSAGTYEVTVTDACGNTETDELTIQFFNTPTLDLGPDKLICENGVHVIDAGMDFASYVWSDGSSEQTITAWLEGTYAVTVTNICGGTQTDEVVVSYDNSTIVNLPDTLSTCPGGSVNIAAPGFLNYDWSPLNILDCGTCPTINASPSSNMTVHLIAETISGCYSADSVVIILEDTIRTFEDVSICAGDSIDLFGQIESTAGIYSENFNGLNGCDSVHEITLHILDTIKTFEDLSICTGDSIDIFGIAVNAPGIYSEKFNGGNGCDSVHEITLYVVDTIQTFEDIFICSGDSVFIFGNLESTSGIYTENFNSSSGCDSVHQITLDIDDVITSLESVDLCIGDSIMVFGNWVSTAGNYSELFTTANGCDSLHTVEVFSINDPGLYSFEQIEVCFGDSIYIFDNWIYESTVLNQTFPSSFECDSVHQVEINFTEEIIMDIASNYIIQSGETVQLIPENLSMDQDLVYSWNPTEGLNCIDCLSPLASPTETTLYTLTATDESNCSITIATTVVVNLEPGNAVYLANSFSPNGDQLNDFLFPQGNDDSVKILELSIYDRWGEIVFSNKNFVINDPGQGWDGTLNGKKMNPGVFVTVLKYERLDGDQEVEVGDVLLLR